MTGPRLIGWRLSAPGRLIGRLAGSRALGRGQPLTRRPEPLMWSGSRLRSRRRRSGRQVGAVAEAEVIRPM